MKRWLVIAAAAAFGFAAAPAAAQDLAADCPAALESAATDNAFTLLQNAQVCGVDAESEAGTFLLILGQLRARTDIA
ncbi:MAG: hypothetical protein AAF684_03420, partial [Pseudomonadota bacterium]